MKYRCGEMGHLALEYDLTNTLQASIQSFWSSLGTVHPGTIVSILDIVILSCQAGSNMLYHDFAACVQMPGLAGEQREDGTALGVLMSTTSGLRTSLTEGCVGVMKGCFMQYAQFHQSWSIVPHMTLYRGRLHSIS